SFWFPKRPGACCVAAMEHSKRRSSVREELELERDRCRRRPGDRDLRRTGERAKDTLSSTMPYTIIHPSIFPNCSKTTFLQSIHFQSSMFMFLNTRLPPSMCFRAFSASSGVSNST
uniref:Uncharacterized protein n=1 Tax=Sander lucioperca TaxID=283035 RepID=A0A8D0AGM5_SANLU